VPILGIGTVRCTLLGHEVPLCKVYHSPGINAFLLSIQMHQRCGQGCSSLTFPTFSISIDDTNNCLVPISPGNPSLPLECKEPTTCSTELRSARQSSPPSCAAAVQPPVLPPLSCIPPQA
jgi:hypothetical protein